MIYDLRRHYGGIICRQENFIGILSQKLELLKVIIGILLVVTIIIRFSSSPCEADPHNTSRIQQDCIEQKALLNCDKDSSKNNSNWKICEEITLCLKDPLSYKKLLDDRKWKEMLSEIEDYLEISPNNAMWLGICIIVGTLYKYYRLK
jgi:hypothetical protein